MSFQRRTLEGKKHIVTPVVMLVLGVHRGSSGEILYPLNELRRSVHAWNGKPLVVYHPSLSHNGSAGSPDIFEQQRIGWIFNTRLDGDRLVAEAWIEEARAAIVDRRVIEAVLNGQMLEVSTGLWLEQTPAYGEFNGRPYRFVASDFQPDHLAVLPDQVGACSIADGCGLVRNELEECLA